MYWEGANWTSAYYYTDNVPTWDSGMDQAWQDSPGILAPIGAPGKSDSTTPYVRLPGRRARTADCRLAGDRSTPE